PPLSPPPQPASASTPTAASAVIIRIRMFLSPLCITWSALWGCRRHGDDVLGPPGKADRGVAEFGHVGRGGLLVLRDGDHARARVEVDHESGGGSGVDDLNHAALCRQLSVGRFRSVDP